MLVDVEFKRPDPMMAMMLAVAGPGGSIVPERVGKGLYLAGHWNVGNMVRGGVRDRWIETPASYLDFTECGVCDTPQQVVDKLKLEEREEPFFVAFVKIRRADQPHSGGWRWHKWGSYIGDKEPSCEYLHDETDIEDVYTFHVYEPAMKADA